MLLELLRLEIASHLVKIEDLINNSDYQLTLVARNTKLKNADLLLTTDDLEKVILAIKGLSKEKDGKDECYND